LSPVVLSGRKRREKFDAKPENREKKNASELGANNKESTEEKKKEIKGGAGKKKKLPVTSENANESKGKEPAGKKKKDVGLPDKFRARKSELLATTAGPEKKEGERISQKKN